MYNGIGSQCGKGNEKITPSILSSIFFFPFGPKSNFRCFRTSHVNFKTWSVERWQERKNSINNKPWTFSLYFRYTSRPKLRHSVTVTVATHVVRRGIHDLGTGRDHMRRRNQVDSWWTLSLSLFPMPSHLVVVGRCSTNGMMERESGWMIRKQPLYEKKVETRNEKRRMDKLSHSIPVFETKSITFSLHHLFKVSHLLIPWNWKILPCQSSKSLMRVTIRVFQEMDKVCV